MQATLWKKQQKKSKKKSTLANRFLFLRQKPPQWGGFFYVALVNVFPNGTTRSCPNEILFGPRFLLSRSFS